MKHYCIDDFIRNTSDTFATTIDKKISLLYDFCILRRSKRLGCDTREHILRTILSQYSNEYAISNAIRPILMGDITLNDFIKSKEII
jgi:hypothetical protein